MCARAGVTSWRWTHLRSFTPTQYRAGLCLSRAWELCQGASRSASIEGYDLMVLFYNAPGLGVDIMNTFSCSYSEPAGATVQIISRLRRMATFTLIPNTAFSVFTPFLGWNCWKCSQSVVCIWLCISRYTWYTRGGGSWLQKHAILCCILSISP